MAETTKIEWTATPLPDGTSLPGFTFNPWTGCTKVSPGCDHCYAESWAKRSGLVKWGAGQDRRRTSADYWRQPIKWNRHAEASGIRRKVFCASLADVFDNQVPDEWRMDLYALIGMTPHLDWLLLTKRPQNIAKMMPSTQRLPFFPNVWLGTTVENQEEADRRIPHLLAVPAAVRFLSCEPLLGPLSFRWMPGEYLQQKFSEGRVDEYDGLRRISWVIAGGESGHGARPPMIGWARSLRDQCVSAGVPFFWKQWGEYTPDDPTAAHTSMVRVGKKAAGALLDGQEWRQFPETPNA